MAYSALETLLLNAAASNNMSAIRKTMINITEAQAGLIAPAVYSTVLTSIINYTSINDQETALAARTFMAKAAAWLTPQDISYALTTLSFDYNFAALDAITDYIQPFQKAQLEPSLIGSTLARIASYSFYPFYNFTNDPIADAATASAIRNFMEKLGDRAQPEYIISAIQMFALDYNFAALDAVTDNIQAFQKPLLDPYALGETLIRISTYGIDPDNHAETASNIRNFMKKFGEFIPSAHLNSALSQGFNLAALDAVIDYIQPFQKPLLDPFGLYWALINTAFVTFHVANTDSNPFSTSTVHNFMQKLGSFIPSEYVGSVVFILLNIQDSDLSNKICLTVQTILDELNPTVLAEIKAGQWFLSNYLIEIGSNSKDTLIGTDGDDRLFGLDNRDVLFGNAGNDVLLGGYGTNRLIGGEDNDILTGGAGRDTFVLNADGSIDTITDFTKYDRIDLSSILEEFDSTTDLITDYVLCTTIGNTTKLFVDQDGSASGAAIAVATIENTPNFDIATLYNNGQIIV